MSLITSRQHTIVKEFRDLAQGRGSSMLLDGWHLVGEALRAGVHIDTLVTSRAVAASERALIERVRRKGARIIDVSATVMDSISPVKSPTGVVARAERPRADPMASLKPAPALVLAAIGLQDPGNVGALIRSAAAAGATGVVVDESSADPWGWKALRASMGSCFHVPVLRTDDALTSVVAWRQAKLSIVAAVPRNGTSMYDFDFRESVAILIGGEGAGLPTALLKAADARVSIPMQGAVESLNVAVASALLLYEARRQRNGR